MEKYSKFDDTNAVLKKAKKSLDKIETEYEKSLTKQTISDDLLVEIKDFFGNLRSSLDYSRHKVSRFNFPICKTEKEFKNATTDLTPELKGVIEKWQPFNNNQWLAIFNTLNNKSKHITLIPQTRRETTETRVTHPNGSRVSWTQGVTFGGGVSVMGVPIAPSTQMPVPNNIVKTEKITWVNFEFDNSQIPELEAKISALPFIQNCFNKICQLVTDMET